MLLLGYKRASFLVPPFEKGGVGGISLQFQIDSPTVILIAIVGSYFRNTTLAQISRQLSGEKSRLIVDTRSGQLEYHGIRSPNAEAGLKPAG